MYICCVQVESAIRPLLDAYFPPLSGVQVLAQPGTFYVASAFTLAVSVIGRKVVTRHWDSLAQGKVLVLLSELFFVLSFSPVKSDIYYVYLPLYGCCITITRPSEVKSETQCSKFHTLYFHR